MHFCRIPEHGKPQKSDTIFRYSTVTDVQFTLNDPIKRTGGLPLKVIFFVLLGSDASRIWDTFQLTKVTIEKPYIRHVE